MAEDMRAWVYTTDQGREYQVGVAAYIAAQESPPGTPMIGGRAQLASEEFDSLPGSLKPRTVTVVNAASGKTRQITCLSQSAPLLSATPPTIQLQDGAGDLAAYGVYTSTGERKRRRKPGV
jgi:hypothetical protein